MNELEWMSIASDVYFVWNIKFIHSLGTWNNNFFIYYTLFITGVEVWK